MTFLILSNPECLRLHALAGAGPDLLACETIPCRAEAEALLELLRRAQRAHHARTGKYVSVSVVIEASSREQLDAIYDDLTTHEKVLMRL